MVNIFDYIDGLLKDLPVDMDGESATPAASHLFSVNSVYPVLLGEERAQLFHHVVAKSLFLCKRSRPDLQTAGAFLCTRVKVPNEDDYKKLVRMVQYLRATRRLVHTLEADDLTVVKWWANSYYAVHPDMKSHTGGNISLGKGAIYGLSIRQKLNTKSSTEAELVGASNVMPQVLCTRYFLKAQGYPIRDNVLYQDNQSAMLLEKNGRGSSSKRTRHINIRYFFIADRISNDEVRVEYCPTGDMVADFFTKPLQGSLFRKMSNAIMNIEGGSDSMQPRNHRSVLKDEKATDEGQTWATVASGKSKISNNK